ncbi:MAG: trypsin-like peptidase domain-containing protein [Chloracidobacterium sp.]|nr:trypsin-like peptidase domain-containing protein [Chloracidobacterium sp.]
MRKLIYSIVLAGIILGLIQHTHAQQLRDLFARSNPSVVEIKTLEKKVAGGTRTGLVSLPGLGSGVLISNDGKILTAAHVVQTADRVSVEFHDGKIVPARVVASYPVADVAMLQLETEWPAVTPARLGDSDDTGVGDDVFVIGAPYGLSHSLTVGHISGKHKSKETVAGLSNIEMFQTDAAINQGNSGGPMFNMAGEVIGIVSTILSRSGGFEGLGFAITSNVARKLLFDNKSFWTGIDAYLLVDEMAKIFNIPQAAGLLVMRAADNSPASDLGLQAGTVRVNIGGEELILGGDIILEVAGIPIVDGWNTRPEFRAVLSRLKPGEKYGIKVFRAGKTIELSAQVRQ